MPNSNPIFSRVGDIQGGVNIANIGPDYLGQSINNKIVFQADQISGGFLQRLRFKAAGTNQASVARIFINDGNINLQSNIGNIGSAPTASVSSSGGNILAGTYWAKVAAVDQSGQQSAVSSESTGYTTTGNTSSITWSWTGVAGAAYYRLFVGDRTGGENIYFVTNVAGYTQTLANINPQTNLPAQGQPDDFLTTNYFYGEVSLPATTGTNTAATVDVDYPMNLALPPGYHVLVGLGNAVTAGWYVTSLAGKY
jgi:hypothetical protein